MSDSGNHGEISRAASLGGQIDMLCDRFEAAWKAGQRPKIEDYLGESAEDQRAGLLRELVAMEIELRQAAHEQPATEEYLTRFPQFGGEIAAAFTRTPSPAMAETVAQAEGSTPAPSPALHVRCPHCHNPVELLDDTPSAEIACNVCGSSFSLVGDEALAYQTIGGTRRRRQKIGRFELTEQLGSGAYGAVWKAHDSQLDRVVAVKTPRKGALTHEETEKILREARAAAQLRHPNIVSVHEVGLDGDLIYTVSDFVEGVSLQDWLTAQRFTHREAAGLCAKIADAIHFAHEHGVIHRDLKPSNIMLDGSGEPHIMDFGLARRESGEVTMTMEGQVLGTPAYMSPEQARGEGHSADRRTDVYSLGVIFFQLLTGEMPFRGNIRMLIKQVLEDPPPRPRKLDNRIPRDLETICLKCLEKNPARRYPSAQEVATELRRHLKGEPIKARPISALARTWRWCQRNPKVAVLSAVLLFGLLVLGFAGPTVAIYESGLRARAERQERIAVALRLAGESREALKSDPQRSVALAVEALTTTLRYGEPPPPDGQAQKALGDAVDSIRDKSLRLLVGGTEPSRVPVAISANNRWLATVGLDGTARLWDLAARDPSVARTVLRGNGERIDSLTITPDSRWLVTIGPSVVQLWSLTVEEPSGATLVAPAYDSGTVAVSVSPDSRWLATVSSDAVRLWNLTRADPSAGPIVLCAGQGRGATVTISPNSRWLVTRSADETHLWNLSLPDPSVAPAILLERASQGSSSDRTRPSSADVAGIQLDDFNRDAVGISPDSHWLAVADVGGRVRIYDLTTASQEAKPIVVPDEGAMPIRTLSFSANNRWLIVGRLGNESRAWDLTKMDSFTESTAIDSVLRIPVNTMGRLAVTPDSRWLVAASGPVSLWDLAPGALGARPIALKGVACTPSGAISPDSHWLLTIEGGKTLYLWDLSAENPAAKPTVLRGHEDVFHCIHSVSISRDSRWLAAHGEKTTSVWDLKAKNNEAPKVVLSGHEGVIASAAVSPNNRWLVTCDEYTARLWDLSAPDPSAAGVLLARYEPPRAIAAISRDGRWLVTNGHENVLELWDLTIRNAAALPGRLGGHEAEVTAVVISPDSRWLITGSRDKTARLWDLTAEDPAAEPVVLRGHTGEILDVAISPNGRWLASGSSDKTARLWDLSAGDPSAKSIVLRGHVAGIHSLAVSPDSHWLLTGSFDQTALLRNLTAKDPAAATLVWRGHARELPVALINLGSHWLVASSDRTAAMWNRRLADLRTTAGLLAESPLSEARAPQAQTRAARMAQSQARQKPPKKSLEERAVALRARLPSAKKLVTVGWVASWSPDGTQIVYGNHRTDSVHILTLQSGITTTLVAKGRDPAWSPGGRWIAFNYPSEFRESTPDDSVWIVAPTGANARRLGSGFWPRWSGDGKTLFYTSPTHDKIMALQPDLPDAKPLEFFDAAHHYPVVSPDGKRVVHSQSGNLVVVDRASGKAVKERSLRGWEGLVAAWSPDGKQIAFGSYGFDNSVGLWRLDLETDSEVQITDGPYTAPCWSPDGSKLLFQLRANEGQEIWMIETKNLAGLKPEAVPVDQSAESLRGLPGARRLASNCAKASFSPDGSRVVFGKERSGAGLQILDLKSGVTTELLPFGKDPAWSPGDGRLIAFARGGGDAEEVWLVEAAGGKPRKVSDGGFPTWSLDGKSIYFQSRKSGKLQVIRVDAEGAKATDVMGVSSWYPAVSRDGKLVAYRNDREMVIADLKSGKTVKTWPIPGGTGFLAGWSPDGKQIAYGGWGETDAVSFSIVNFDSDRAVRLAIGGATMPAWSPDGLMLAFDVRLGAGGPWEIWMVETKVLGTLKPER